MKVTTKLKNNELRFYLNGELDQSVAEKIRIEMDNYLKKVSPTTVTFDMSNLIFMDSTGIGLILGRYKYLKSRNIPMYIGSPNPQIDKVIKLSGLYSIIPLSR